MKLALCFVLIVELVWGDVPENCSSIPCIPGYNLVSSSTTESSKGYTPACGEGEMRGKKLCVDYDMCDPNTNTIMKKKVTFGRGKIQIRFGQQECPQSLEVCCKIPEEGLSEDFDPQPVPPTPPQKLVPATRSPITNASRCGIRNENGIDFTITGNVDNEAQYGEFPWMVGLVKRNFQPSQKAGFSFCGGSVLSASVVLTTAHCAAKYPAGEIKIRAGEWDSVCTKERYPYQERNVAQIIMHEDYLSEELFNDVALLILETPLDQAEHIGTICLPEEGQVILSKNCFVTGWGRKVQASGPTHQHILKKIELPMVPARQCQTSLRTTSLTSYFILHNSFVCAGGEKGKDACTGDGGSPLVCPDPRNPNRYILAGMVAWGMGCGEQDIPGAYANVAKFRYWIDNHMRKLNFNTDAYII